MGDPVSGLIGGGLKAAGGAAKGGKGGDGGSSGGGNDAQSEYQYMQNLNKIRARYADLGLGGSTMETQDEAGAGLGFLANQANIQNQNTQTGLQALSTLGGLANQQQQQGDYQAGTASVGGTGPGTGSFS